MRRVSLFVLLLFSANIHAAYYYLRPADSSTKYATAELACAAYLAVYNPSIPKTFTRWANSDGTDPNVSGVGYCYYQQNKTDGTLGTEQRASSPVRRYGEASVCTVSNSPAAIVSRGPYGPVITSQSGEKYILSPSPETVCSGTCMYEKPAQSNTKNCFLKSGETDTGFCNYAFTLTTDENGEGTACSASTLIPEETGDQFNANEPAQDHCQVDPTDDGCSESGGGSGGDTGEGGDTGNGGDTGDTGSGGGTGDGGSGGGSGTGDGGSDSGSDGSDDGSGSGSGDGSGSTPGGDSAFNSPGALDLSVDNSQRELQAKQKFSEFKQQLDNTETFRSISTAFSGSNSHQAAACPVGSVSLFGQNIIFDSHCDLFASIRPILSAVFIALWSLLAVRIVLSA